jgi:aryl-alcohol dehydrogenase-like predicted oxidoreductase
MEKRKLGNTDLAITPVGLGAWAMGGGHRMISFRWPRSAARLRRG